jgi:hypothetical protein
VVSHGGSEGGGHGFFLLLLSFLNFLLEMEDEMKDGMGFKLCLVF